MLVTDGDRALLGRNKNFPLPGMYSTLAGFVEPGESLEDAVAREVREETGIEVCAVYYHSSQPWPFPGNIMLGFHAEARTTEITIDYGELEDARWFTRDWLISHTDDDNFRMPRLELDRPPPDRGLAARAVSLRHLYEHNVTSSDAWLFLLFFAANYQPSRSRPPRESWAADGSTTEEQPGRLLFFAVSLRNSDNHKVSPTASTSFSAVRDETRYAYSQRYHNRCFLSIWQNPFGAIQARSIIRISHYSFRQRMKGLRASSPRNVANGWFWVIPNLSSLRGTHLKADLCAAARIAARRRDAVTHHATRPCADRQK